MKQKNNTKFFSEIKLFDGLHKILALKMFPENISEVVVIVFIVTNNMVQKSVNIVGVDFLDKKIAWIAVDQQENYAISVDSHFRVIWSVFLKRVLFQRIAIIAIYVRVYRIVFDVSVSIPTNIIVS